MTDPRSRMRAAERAVRSAVRRAHWSATLKPRRATIAAIEARKREQQRSGVSYVERPKVAIIVQSFNQRRNVSALEARLRRTCAEELIVCEDGSLDGSHEAWAERLTRPNDFLIRSNDIHEIRAYDRAFSLARSDIVCLMQDDDRPPADGRWLAEALDIFARHPAVAILGGWCGFNAYFAEEYNAPWLPAGAGQIPTVDPHSGGPLMFVENVNIGPYIVRREAYHELGGFDRRFSPPGEPGITFEAELCYRAWRSGYQVALTDIPVKRVSGQGSYILPGGTSLWGNEARVRNERANKARIAQIYEKDIEAIRAAVRAANRSLEPTAA